jgi:hypothetical protein
VTCRSASKEKGRRTKAAHRSPDQGAKWNSDGRRPLRGVAQIAASTFKSLSGSGWSFCGEAVFDAHASFSCELTEPFGTELTLIG